MIDPRIIRVYESIKRKHALGVVPDEHLREIEEIYAEAVREAEGDAAERMPPERMTPERVKAIRAKEGLSQAKFAKALQIGLTTYQKWERGNPEPTGISLLALRHIERHGLDAFLG